MKRNQTEWIKWYRNKTGKEWKESDVGVPDLSMLNDLDREVGELLYERYVREKKDADEYRYQEATADATTQANLRKAARESQKLAKAQEETALAYGQAGTNAAEKGRARIAKSAEKLNAAAREKAIDTQDALIKRYAKKRDQADETLAKALDKTEKRYRKQYAETWSELQKTLSEDLKGYVSEFDGASYTDEGVAKVNAAIRDNREALGDQYERALSWAQSLPVYQGETNGKMLTVGKEKQFVYDRDLAYADVVNYRTGAGGKVTRWDIFSVEYNGVRYSVKAEKEVDGEKGALLSAIADYKEMPLKTGSLIYYRGALYVYDGDGAWRDTSNVASASNPSSLTHLIRALDSSMNK